MLRGPLLVVLGVVLYGALHSFLASNAVKDAARSMLGSRADRYYRLVYNFLGGLTFLPVLALLARFPGASLYQIPYPWTLLTLALQGVAALLLILGLLQTDLWHFLGVRQFLGQGDRGSDQLVVRGIYCWVRHPLYTAGLLFIWLTPLMTTSILALNLSLTLYIVIGSVFEERRLLVAFGEAYHRYQSEVPRLIPRPWRCYSG
jgi:protein-S-isoprenylcysteine O-methyltransferase Ste14